MQKLPNVTILENTEMVDIVEQDNVCYGIVCRVSKEAMPHLITISAKDTVWACGGIGGLYTHSTNFPHLTGDALALSLRHHIKLENIDYIQIHPTTLYSEKPGRRFLISESVRGEGAILLNRKGERFVDELLPRDVVARAIYEQMEKDDMPYVHLSLENIDKKTIMEHFPNIYQHCLEEGYDITKESIPVVPAQHYFMGGVHVDCNSKTSMEQLYAVGEASVTVCMAQTVWQAIPCLKVWSLRNVRQSILQTALIWQRVVQSSWKRQHSGSTTAMMN